MGVRERKEREREQRKLDILESARRVFLTHGLDHASMDRIAEEAELAKGTLYLYYRNRDELLMALVNHEFENLIEQMEKVLKSKAQPEKKLMNAIATFFKFSQDNELFYQIITQLNVKQLFGCANIDGSEAVIRFRETNSQMMEMMSLLVQEGVDAGVFHLEHPVSYVVLQMIIALKGIMVILRNKMLPPEWLQYDDGKILTDTAQLMMRGLMSAPSKHMRKAS